MKIRTAIAGAALAGTLVLTGGAAVGAAEPPHERPPASAECKAAFNLLVNLHRLDDRVRADYRKVKALRDRAAAAGNTQAVRLLDAKLAQLRTAHAHLVAKIRTVAAEVREECAAPTAAAA